MAEMMTARAGNHLFFWLLSALRAHTKAPCRTDLLRETLRPLNRRGRAQTERQDKVERVVGVVPDSNDDTFSTTIQYPCSLLKVLSSQDFRTEREEKAEGAAGVAPLHGHRETHLRAQLAAGGLRRVGFA